MLDNFEYNTYYRFIFPERPNLSYTFELNGFVGEMQDIIDGKPHKCTSIIPSEIFDNRIKVGFDNSPCDYIWDRRDFVEVSRMGDLLETENNRDWIEINLKWDFYKDADRRINIGDEVIAKVKISGAVIFTYGILEGLTIEGKYVIKPLIKPYKSHTKYFAESIRQPGYYLKVLLKDYTLASAEYTHAEAKFNAASETLMDEMVRKFNTA